MGRTKGSKNGIRKVPIKKTHPDEEQKYEYVIVEKHSFRKTRKVYSEDDKEKSEAPHPAFDAIVLKAFRDQDYENCIERISTILLNPRSKSKNHYRILQAASYTMLGVDFKSAHTILDDVIRDDPENSYALYGKGVAYYFQKRLDESLDMLNRAIAVNPDEMQRAKEMKVRIDLERRQAVIFLQKVDHEDLVQQSSLPKEPSETPNEVKNIEKVIKIEIPELTAKAQSEDQEPMILDKQFDVDIKKEMLRLPIITEKSVNTPNNKMHKKYITELQKNLQHKPAEEQNTTSHISKSLPKSSDLYTCAQEFFEKGMELYMCGALKKALKMFGKAVKLKSSFEQAEEMGAKSQELLELMDMANLNMSEKNYHAVIEILNEALKVDDSNHFVNRPFFFQRGLAYFHLGQDEQSMKDYADFDRLNKLLDKK
jgi:tetratricopeptide (TPR) repeat protein